MVSLSVTCLSLLLFVTVNAEESDHCGYDEKSWYKAMGWCYHSGSRLLLGDFNGDKRTDFFCHDSNGKNWVAVSNSDGSFGSTTWQDSKERWCASPNILLTGDFNGDGVTDILCHGTATGKKWIKYFNKYGVPSGKSFYRAMGWCYQKGSQLYIGDFNGDKRDDLLCHDTSGRYWTSYAGTDESKVFHHTSWYKALEWCRHATSKLYLGDFNGDKKTDVLCTDGKGYKWIMYAKTSGNLFTGTDWHTNLDWCHESSTVFLRIGDVNGDGKDDLVCHSTAGNSWVAYTQPKGGFGPEKLQNHRGMFYHLAKWCTAGKESFFLGYFNQDSRADILCHDTKYGKKWIRYGECPFAKRR